MFQLLAGAGGAAAVTPRTLTTLIAPAQSNNLCMTTAKAPAKLMALNKHWSRKHRAKKMAMEPRYCILATVNSHLDGPCRTRVASVAGRLK